jgi:hypothetical protein
MARGLRHLYGIEEDLSNFSPWDPDFDFYALDLSNDCIRQIYEECYEVPMLQKDDINKEVADFFVNEWPFLGMSDYTEIWSETDFIYMHWRRRPFINSRTNQLKKWIKVKET